MAGKAKTSGTLTVRAVTEGDLPEWTAMGLKLWPHYKTKKRKLDLEFRRILAAPRETAFFCEDKTGRPIGFINLSMRSDYVEGSSSSPVGYIEGVYVKPDYRRRGAAAKLVGAAKKWAKENGCKELGSDTELKNRDSQKFHRALGFKEAETIVHYIKKLR